MAQHAYHPYPPTMMAAHSAHDEESVLLDRLRTQVEFYFSPQNLARDTYLRSILQKNDNGVLVETIANFPKVKELHAVGRLGMAQQHDVPKDRMPPADPVFLCRALEKSHVVTVSNDLKWIRLILSTAQPSRAAAAAETMLSSSGAPDDYEQRRNAIPNNHDYSTLASCSDTRSPPSSPSSQTTAASSAGVPTHPIPPPLKEQQRTILVIWDVPEGCTVEEVMYVLGSAAATQPQSAQYDGSTNTWYIAFANEHDAATALAASVHVTIRGMPIHAGMIAAPPPPSQQQQQQLIPTAATAMPIYHPPPHQQQQLYPPGALLAQGYPVPNHHDGVGGPDHHQHQQHYYGVPAMPQQFHPAGGGGHYAPPPQPPVQYNAPTMAYPTTTTSPYYPTESPMVLPQGGGHNHQVLPPHGQPLPSPHMIPPQQPLLYNYHDGGYYVPQQYDTRPPQQQQNRPSFKKRGIRKGNRGLERSFGGQQDYDDTDSNKGNARQSNYNRDANSAAIEATSSTSSSMPQIYRDDMNSSPFPSSDGSYRNRKNQGGRRNNKPKRKQGSSKEQVPGKDEFPALVENSKTGRTKSAAAPTTKKTLGYAAVVKKKPTATLPPPSGEATSTQRRTSGTPGGQSTSQRTDHLEEELSKLIVSSPEQDSWNGVDDSQVQEEW